MSKGIFKQEIPIENVTPVTGTWATTVASNVRTKNKTATDETSTIYFDILPPVEMSGTQVTQGVKLLTVVVPYVVTVAALEAVPTLALYKVTEVAGTADTAASVTGTLAFSGDDTTGTAVGEYRATFTITTPEFVQDLVRYGCEFVINSAATTVPKVKNPFFTFEGC